MFNRIINYSQQTISDYDLKAVKKHQKWHTYSSDEVIILKLN